MNAFCIAIKGHEYSQAVALRCIESGKSVGRVSVALWEATGADIAIETMRAKGLRWSWGVEPLPGGMRAHYYGGSWEARVGCAMSHFRLWEECVRLDEPILILEHDAVFIRALPDFEFDGICQVNDPRGATPRGGWWSGRMTERGPGVFPKTRVLEHPRPDGLAGNSAYVIKPWAAQELIGACRKYGLWPNDAIMCVQLFPYLQEHYPFITRVEQAVSTTQDDARQK